MRVVVDLGGDETGARAIGRFRNKVPDEEYDLLFVVNPYRPFTSTAQEVEAIARQIEVSSRLRITALVSNPHLLTETSVSDIITGVLPRKNLSNGWNRIFPYYPLGEYKVKSGEVAK